MSSAQTITHNAMPSDWNWFKGPSGGKAVTRTVTHKVITLKHVLPPKPKPKPTPSPRPSSTAPLSSASTSSLSSLTSISSSSLSDSEPLAARSALKRKRNHDASSVVPSKPVRSGPPPASKKTVKNAKKTRVASREGSKVPTAGLHRVKAKKRRDDDDNDGEWGYRTRRSSSVADLLPDVYRKRSREPSTTARDSEERDEFVLPERVIHTEHDGRVMDRIISSKDAVEGLTRIGRYKPGFRNLVNAEDDTFELPPRGFPVVTLEYPNDGSVEEYLMYIPKDKDHYNPLLCLELTLQTTVQELVPHERRAPFGKLPEEALRDLMSDDDDKPLKSLPQTRSASPMPSSNSSSLISSVPSFRMTPESESIPPSSSPSSALTSPPLSPCPPSSPHLIPLDVLPGKDFQPASSPPPSTLLFELRRARATRDGPGYIKALEEINKQLRSMKSDSSGNLLVRPQQSWTHAIPEAVFTRIIEETYQRCIAPEMKKLKKYASFSSQVYGELMPKFVSDIIKQTRLTKGMRFVDLGSGVGNVVLQTALETGCSSYGVELMEAPATLATMQHEQMQLRCRMWGISMGEVELKQGNMVEEEYVAAWLREADVVLVNNFVFKEELNAALRPKFLDLKEGAIVVSLKPFAPPAAHRLTERNIDDISAIFDVSARPYSSGTVSWSNGSGNYYIHRVDRKGYSDSRERYEEVQASIRRTARR